MKKRTTIVFCLLILLSGLLFSIPYNLFSNPLEAVSNTFLLERTTIFMNLLKQVTQTNKPNFFVGEVHTAQIGIFPDFGYSLNVYARPLVDSYLTARVQEYIGGLQNIQNPQNPPTALPDYWGVIHAFRDSNQYVAKVYIKITALSDKRIQNALEYHIQKIMISSVAMECKNAIVFFQVFDLKKETTVLSLGGNVGKVLSGRIDYVLMYYNDIRTIEGLYFRSPTEFSVIDNLVGGLYLVF